MNNEPHRRGRRILTRLAAIVMVAAAAVGIAGGGAVQPSGAATPKPTVVLVHGAFADSTSWSGVIQGLQRKGYNVIAPPNPLRGLPADTQYLKDFLATVEGPVVLVGHSYGGMVISNAAVGDSNVEALVYIAGYAPLAGETLMGLTAKYPGSLLVPSNITERAYTKADGTPGVEDYVTPSIYREAFAADLPKATTDASSVAQHPIDSSVLTDPSGEPAWPTVPSWYMVAKKDQAIPPAAERFMAQRAGSTTVEVNASHSVLISHAKAVVDLIVSAGNATD